MDEIEKNGEFQINNTNYCYKIDLSTTLYKGSLLRNVTCSLYKKDAPSDRVNFNLLGTYYHDDNVFEKSLLDFLKEYLKEHSLAELQQYIKNTPKIQIADIDINWDIPQQKCDIFPLNSSFK